MPLRFWYLVWDVGKWFYFVTYPRWNKSTLWNLWNSTETSMIDSRSAISLQLSILRVHYLSLSSLCVSCVVRWALSLILCIWWWMENMTHKSYAWVYAIRISCMCNVKTNRNEMIFDKYQIHHNIYNQIDLWRKKLDVIRTHKCWNSQATTNGRRHNFDDVRVIKHYFRFNEITATCPRLCKCL